MMLLERKRVDEKRSDKEKSAMSQLMRSYRPSGVYSTAHILWFGWGTWESRWCSNFFAPKHASRALRHVLKIWKNDVVICKAAILEIYHKRYSDLYNANMGRQTAKKRSSGSAEESVAIQQNGAVGNLLQKRGNLGAVSLHQSSFVTPSSSASHLSFARGASGSSTSSYTSIKGQLQPTFAFSSQLAMSMNMDIRKSNNATLEMAIADFFHCKNIPGSVAESPRFLRLI
jgi:hypothetical protein